MKTFFVMIAALLLGYEAGHAQTWESFNSGLEKARIARKPVLIDVYTDWCSWCKKMDATTYTDANVKAYLKKNFIIVKLNAEGTAPISYKGHSMSPAEFAQGMGVTGYPATLFLRSDGEGITLVPGYSEAPMFINILSFISENRYTTQNFSEYLKEKGIKE